MTVNIGVLGRAIYNYPPIFFDLLTGEVIEIDYTRDISMIDNTRYKLLPCKSREPLCHQYVRKLLTEVPAAEEVAFYCFPGLKEANMSYPQCDKDVYIDSAYRFIESWQNLMLDKSEQAKSIVRDFITFDEYCEKAETDAAVEWCKENGLESCLPRLTQDNTAQGSTR